MIEIFQGYAPPGACPLRTDMHRDRKRVFVDLLRWDVPVVSDEFEIDQFDTEHAVYIVAAAPDGSHIGSFRMLPTTQPHILGSLFPDLCDRSVPTGEHIWEITRGCLAPRLRATKRLRVRNRLVSAAVLYAMRHGITRFTCVADSGWLAQIPTMGWDCEPLGEPRRIAGTLTGALKIRIGARTPELLATTGTFQPVVLTEGAAAAPLAA